MAIQHNTDYDVKKYVGFLWHFLTRLERKSHKQVRALYKKTKDTAETIKLNGMISDEEKRINNLFNEIGKTYFKLHAESYEPTFEQMILDIKASQANIENYSEQVKRLKGVVRCPNCGGEVPYGAPFCSSCGSKMNTTITEVSGSSSNINRCAKCGAVATSDNAFCTNCGSKLEKIVPEQSIPASESGVVSPDTICPSCGKRLTQNAVFCSGCGHKIENTRQFLPRTLFVF